MTRAMRALPIPMSAMTAVAMPALGAIDGSCMLPTLAINVTALHITVMGKRPNLVVVMMRRRHSDAYTNAGRSQRGHGKGGGGEAQHGEKMLGGFHGRSFLMNGDYIPSNGPDQPRLTRHLYGFVSAWLSADILRPVLLAPGCTRYSTRVLLHSRRVASSSMVSIASLKCMDLSKKYFTPNNSA